MGIRNRSNFFKDQQYPTVDEIDKLTKGVSELHECNDKDIKFTAGKFVVCVPQEFRSAVILEALSKDSKLKQHADHFITYYETFIVFLQSVAKFHNEAVQYQLDASQNGGNGEINLNLKLDVENTIDELEKVYVTLKELAKIVLLDIEKCIEKPSNYKPTFSQIVKGTFSFEKSKSSGEQYKSIPMDDPNDTDKNMGATEIIERAKSIIEKGGIKDCKNLHDLMKNNFFKKIRLMSGGTLGIVIGVVIAVLGIALAPFTGGATLLTSLGAIGFVVSGGTIILLSSAVLGIGKWYYSHLDLDLEKSLKMLVRIRNETEKMLNALEKNSVLIQQLQEDSRVFMSGLIGVAECQCHCCGKLLVDPIKLKFKDENSNDEDDFLLFYYCRKCITGHYNDQLVIFNNSKVGIDSSDSNNNNYEINNNNVVNGQEDLKFFIPGSKKYEFNLKSFETCDKTNKMVKNFRRRIDELEAKIVKMLESDENFGNSIKLGNSEVENVTGGNDESYQL